MVDKHVWWPLNILFTLLVVAALITLLEQSGLLRYVAATVLLVVAGALVEYLWMGVLACLGAWVFCRTCSNVGLLVWFLGMLSLTVVNRNAWALTTIPLVWAASKVTLRLRRSKWIFLPVLSGTSRRAPRGQEACSLAERYKSRSEG